MIPNSSHVIFFCVIALCLTSPVLTTAQEPSAEIVKYGRYASADLQAKPAENGAQLYDKTPLETTAEIPAKIGEVFGICVMFSDLPKNRGCTVRKVMRHPPFTESDGKVSIDSVDVMRFKAGLVPDRCVFFGWSFLKGYEYELVPGKWTCTIYVDDKEVASKTFEVKK